MSRYVVNDILWGDPEDVRAQADGEIMLYAPIIQEQELNLDPLIEVFIDRLWDQGDANDAFEAAIREWARQNRKFVQPRLNKIAWDADGVGEHGHPPGKSDFGVYLFVEDLCADSFYGHGDTEDGTEIWRNDDRDQTPVLIVPYRADHDDDAHKAFVRQVIDGLNAVETMTTQGPGDYRVDVDEEAGRVYAARAF